MTEETKRLTVRLTVPVFQRLERVRRYEPREAFIKRAIMTVLEAEDRDMIDYTKLTIEEVEAKQKMLREKAEIFREGVEHIEAEIEIIDDELRRRRVAGFAFGDRVEIVGSIPMLLGQVAGIDAEEGLIYVETYEYGMLMLPPNDIKTVVSDPATTTEEQPC